MHSCRTDVIMPSSNYSNDTDPILDGTHWPLRLPIIRGSNDHVPRFLYKEFPILYLSAGVIINCILVYYVIASKRYKSPLFALIASLAIADALACLGFAIRAGALYPVMIRLPHPSLMCKVLLFLGHISAVASAYHLICFALLRYYQLCYPLHARVRVTCSSMFRCCTTIWCAMLVYFIPIEVYQDAMSVVYKGEVTHVCIFTGSLRALDLCFIILNTGIPSVLILFLHILKYTQMRCAAKVLSAQSKRKDTDARAITVIIILFFLSWLPANIYAIVIRYPRGYGIKQDKIYLNLEYAISYNSTLNPIVYCIAAKTVRDDIRKFLSCRK